MCKKDKIDGTRRIFWYYVNHDSPFRLEDLYEEIRSEKCYFFLSPNLSISKFISILEFNGLAKINPDNSILISKQGRIQVKEVYENLAMM
ncbi:MAG: hypothetical protein CVU50_03495 [Candidatus Cloacimonetes bacterium HGW-Cloacimonetes-3]|jgi:hypothetical protein|nr:MAG: hypothetical protein CVU50_03495 [Candidatus Cloacimonetes bacterium HGW-Cloacimonetes-3]